MVNVMKIDTAKSLELKKHVGAIHSSNKLTLVQRKIANALLYNAYDTLLTQDRHSIHIRLLCDLIGYDSRDFKTIKNALIALISSVIQWNLVDKQKEGEEGIWNASSIIADATINGPICTYSYSHNMRELLYHPDLYGRLNMHVQARFKSSYGLALYENCIRYQNITQTPWFDLATFRLLMGVEKSQYPIFRDFKRRVIDTAVKEVNEFAPISVEVKFRKEGRAVTAIQFLIKHQQTRLIDQNSSDELPTTLAGKLKTTFGFSDAQVKKAIKLYEESYILEKIALVETSSSFQAGTIVNLAKYLEHALEEDYQPPKSSRSIVEENRKQKEAEKKRQADQKEKIEKYQRFQDAEILKFYQVGMDTSIKKSVDKEFEKEIKNNIYYDIYVKEGLSNVLVADKFCAFIRSKYKDLLQRLTSFEDFLQLQETPKT